MTTSAIEDYLKMIYQIQEKDGRVTTSALAHAMDVAPASATAMLKKLARMELAEYQPYQGVVLTEEGRRLALQVTRYERLTELFMVEILGMSWDSVHQEAHKWEHVISEEVAARMEEKLGNPTTDPHGHPIPTKNGHIPTPEIESMTTLAPGQRAIIARISGHDPELLRYVGMLGLYPGTPIRVVEVAPFKGPLTLEIEGEQQIVGHNVATQIFVKDIKQ